MAIFEKTQADKEVQLVEDEKQMISREWGELEIALKEKSIPEDEIQKEFELLKERKEAVKSMPGYLYHQALHEEAYQTSNRKEVIEDENI